MYLFNWRRIDSKKFFLLVMPVVLLTVLTFIHPPFPDELLLHHLGTLPIILVLIFDCMQNRFSFFAMFCLSVFGVLHIVGARYLYSYVTYEEWLETIFQTDLDYGKRNQYDRLVHFSFGILVYPMVWELLKTKIFFHLFEDFCLLVL